MSLLQGLMYMVLGAITWGFLLYFIFTYWGVMLSLCAIIAIIKIFK